MATVGAGLCLPLAWPLALRVKRVLAPLAIAALAGALLIIFPRIEALSAVGRGSDQAACVIVGAKELVRGHWPYQRAAMWTQNPMSCGPGWIALQLPATVTVGYALNLIGIWGVSLAVLTWILGWESTASFVALLCLSPGFWLAVADGTDFLTFGITFTVLLVMAERYGHATAGRVLIAVLASLIGQFRAATLILPAFLSGETGAAAMLLAVALSLAWQIAFLLWQPASFVVDGPLHIMVKLTGMHLFATHPWPAILELCLPVALAALAIVWLQKRYRWKAAPAVFLLVLFVLPALLNFVEIAGTTNFLDALQHWEGGLWIAGCLPVITYFLLRSITNAQEAKKASA